MKPPELISLLVVHSDRQFEPFPLPHERVHGRFPNTTRHLYSRVQEPTGASVYESLSVVQRSHHLGTASYMYARLVF